MRLPTFPTRALLFVLLSTSMLGCEQSPREQKPKPEPPRVSDEPLGPSPGSMGGAGRRATVEG